jgi:hypothetical protein
MDRGKFDASQIIDQKNAKAALDSTDAHDVYTKDGLRAILGVQDDADTEDHAQCSANHKMSCLSSNDMEKAMTSLEDDEDVVALRGAQKEAAEELQEFDESIEIKKGTESDDDDEDVNLASTKERKSVQIDNETLTDTVDDKKNETECMEKEFAAWQDKVGMDTDAIVASLTPAERYGLRFREDVDPYYSIFAVQEYNRRIEAANEVDAEIDIDEIERQKAMEEEAAFDDGDLLATRPHPCDLTRQRAMYQREKARVKAQKKRRKLTGQDWETRIDGLTKLPFWHNIDSGESVWDKPHTLMELEAHELATQKRYAAMPLRPLIRVMQFLSPFPDRMRCSLVCKQWDRAVADFSFVRHVYPVEQGAYSRDNSKMEYNHYRTIAEALAASLPGDTIELGDGHYVIKEDIDVNIPLRIIGDENNPSNVMIDLCGTMHWRSHGGFCEGVTFRRPQLSSGEISKREMLRLDNNGKLDIRTTVFDNEGSKGSAIIAAGPGKKGRWDGVVVKRGGCGITLQDCATLDLSKCYLKKSAEYGNAETDSSIMRNECTS